MVLSLAVTLLSLVINSMAGFAFAKYRFRGRRGLFNTLIASMVIPAQVTMLPLFLLLNKMGVINTYLGVDHPRHGEHLRHLPDPPVCDVDP